MYVWLWFRISKQCIITRVKDKKKAHTKIKTHCPLQPSQSCPPSRLLHVQTPLLTSKCLTSNFKMSDVPLITNLKPLPSRNKPHISNFSFQFQFLFGLKANMVLDALSTFPLELIKPTQKPSQTFQNAWLFFSCLSPALKMWLLWRWGFNLTAAKYTQDYMYASI